MRPDDEREEAAHYPLSSVPAVEPLAQREQCDPLRQVQTGVHPHRGDDGHHRVCIGPGFHGPIQQVACFSPGNWAFCKPTMTAPDPLAIAPISGPLDGSREPSRQSPTGAALGRPGGALGGSEGVSAVSGPAGQSRLTAHRRRGIHSACGTRRTDRSSGSPLGASQVAACTSASRVDRSRHSSEGSSPVQASRPP